MKTAPATIASQAPTLAGLKKELMLPDLVQPRYVLPSTTETCGLLNLSDKGVPMVV